VLVTVFVAYDRAGAVARSVEVAASKVLESGSLPGACSVGTP
jgi:hypothetical protein